MSLRGITRRVRKCHRRAISIRDAAKGEDAAVASLAAAVDVGLVGVLDAVDTVVVNADGFGQAAKAAGTIDGIDAACTRVALGLASASAIDVGLVLVLNAIRASVGGTSVVRQAVVTLAVFVGIAGPAKGTVRHA